jgi:hypothetical protein
MIKMSERIAKPIVKNKFWVVEDDGQKIATIQATEDGGCVYVHDEQREHFPNVLILKKKYNIRFGSSTKQNTVKQKSIYSFPIVGRAYNQVWDVQRKLAIYSKLPKSKSFYCAGYFTINTNGLWQTVFCPKNITISRYQYHGPFGSELEANTKSKELNDATNQSIDTKL